MAGIHLIEAARGGDLVALRAAFAAGADANATGADGTTALEAACRAGQVAAVRLLLQNGARPTPGVWLSLGADPAVAFLVETADLESSIPQWLAVAVAREEATADMPALAHAVGHGTAAARRSALDRLASAARAGAPLAPTLAAFARALDDTDAAVSAAACRIVTELARVGFDVPVDLQALALVRRAHTPEERALLEEAIASSRLRGEAALMERVLALREQAKVPASGGAAGAAARALAADALERDPPDRAALDRLCGHALPEARQAAVEAVGRAWRDGSPPDLSARVVAALADEAPSVRGVAAGRLEEAWRDGLALAIPDALFVRLVECLREQDSQAIALVLSHHVASDRSVAARALELLGPQAAGATGPAADLARLCRAIAEGRRPLLCPSCGSLEDETDWGEYVGHPTVPEPAAFRRLEQLGSLSWLGDLYRCRVCGSYFTRTTCQEEFYGNSTWDSYTLKRWPASALENVVYEAARTGDFTGLDAALRDVQDDAALRRLLNTLAPFVRNGKDISVLRPALRALAGPVAPQHLRNAALSLLGETALRANDADGLVASVESGDDAEKAAALDALGHAPVWGAATARQCALRLRATLWALASEKGRHQAAALRVLSSAGLDRETITEAVRRLDVESPAGRAAAARILGAAAQDGVRLSGALPRLAALLGDDVAGNAALDALTAARAHGSRLAPLVPELAAFIHGQPESPRARAVARLLHELQKEGADISEAFGPLALMGGEWLVTVATEALERHQDISITMPALQRLAAGNEGAMGYLSRTAVEILARNFVRQRDWQALEQLLRHPVLERADAARAAVERAVRAREADQQALLFLGSVEAGEAPATPAASAPPVKPARTSWSKDRDHVEVSEREVLAWTDGPFGGNGRSVGLDEFLAGEMQDTVSSLFGARVLRDAVEAARWFAARRKKPSKRGRRKGKSS